MRISVFAVGKSRTEYYEPAIAEYQKRLSRWTDLAWDTTPTSTPEKESRQLLGKLPVNATMVLLDERGQRWSNPELTNFIETSQNNAIKELAFVIGGAHGVNEDLRKRADAVWSLSPLVFPHEMVRLIVAEQLYRAYDILHDGNYHH